MGLFDKIKNMFAKEEKSAIEGREEQTIKVEKNAEKIVEEDVKVYEKGLTKSRENFVSKLINLNL